MSNATSLLLAAVTLMNILACLVLIYFTSRRTPDEVADGEVKSHVWDDDLQELNNPMPRWWLNLFIITIVCGIGYLVVYPGLGAMAGTAEWTSTKEMQAKLDEINGRRNALLGKFAGLPVEQIASSEDARAIGAAIFGANCAGCHGSKAEGALGYPNLTDNDWLYGGTPEAILHSITEGRNGQMPVFNGQLDTTSVNQLAALVSDWKRNAGDEQHAAALAQFNIRCAACHGADGAGNQMIGAPRLNDDVWLYGGTQAVLRQSILFGRQGQMPAHKKLLSSEEIRLVAGYVYSLSR